MRAVGCTGGSAGLVTNGPRDRKVVALTFDDGPSEYTPGFLDVLREKHVHGTFFEIGQEMAGREATMRQILREGNEIGNHTMHHAEYPGYGEIAAGHALIERLHPLPALPLPPAGRRRRLLRDRRPPASLGMRTITWDVDPRDWSNPGSAAVYSRVVGAARPGSIILMHDGGGDRGGTLAALPGSSTPCAPAATASPRSPPCSATGSSTGPTVEGATDERRRERELIVERTENPQWLSNAYLVADEAAARAC